MYVYGCILFRHILRIICIFSIDVYHMYLRRRRRYILRNTMTKTHHSHYRDEILAKMKEAPEKRYGAQELYHLLKEEGSDINLATVYRNLDRLEEEKRIHKLRMNGEEENMYQYMKPACSSHLHLYCRDCGKVIHLEEKQMEAIRQQLLSVYGFEVDCQESYVAGVCEECRRKEKKNDGHD